MNKKILPIFLTAALLCLAITPTVTGQTATQAATNQQTQIKATGTVTDSHSEVLIGVAVKLKGTKVIAVTDAQGTFVLNIPQGHKNPVLTFNYLGMSEQEIAYKGTHLTVTMNDNNMLEGVVVTGMFNRAKESYTGAATLITSEDMEQAGSRSMLTSISNIDPSFNIISTNLGSDPNALMQINMRGDSSLPMGIDDIKDNSRSGVNTPLFILDGFEVSLRKVMDLDETQIDNIVLLKDASATAVYGTKASNGVVVINLKRPVPGRLTATYTGALTIEAPMLSSYNLMNAREKLAYEKAANLYEYKTYPDLQQNLNDLYNKRLLDIERGIDTYWIRYPVRTGVGSKHSLRIEGGESAFVYSGSLSYNKTAGAMKGSDRITINGAIRFEYQLGRLKFINDLQIGSAKATNSPYGSFDQYTKANSYFTPYDEDGNLLKVLDEWDRNKFEGQLTLKKMYNPLYNAYTPSKNTTEDFDIAENFFIEYDLIPKELKIRGGVSYKKANGREDIYTPANNTMFDEYTGEDIARKGKYQYSPNYSSSYDANISINYNKSINKVHVLFAGLNGSIEEKNYERYSITAEGFSLLDMDFLGMANYFPRNGNPNAHETITRSVGTKASASYTYDKRYFVDGSAIIEASSQFGADNRFAPFWSLGAGWNLHHENFLKDNRVIQRMLIKVGYGLTGKQTFAPYQALTTYKILASNYMNWNGVSVMALGNPELGWEKTKQLNIGGDMAMFDNRFTFEFNWYNKVSNNLLTNVDLPTASGFANYKSNIGKVQNRGFELKATVVLIRDKAHGINWTIGGNANQNKNKILEISDALKSLNDVLLGLDERNPSFLYREGESMKTIFAVRSKGIDPSNGKEVFYKLDGSETYTWDKKDQVACGVAEPLLWGTINTTFRYKGLSLTAFLKYTTGGYQYNRTLVNKIENINASENADRRALYGRWQKPGDIAQYKAVTDNSYTNATTRFVMKNEVFSGESVTLQYIVPKKWTQQHLNCQSLTLKANTENFFYSSTIEEERGGPYPYSKKFIFTLTARS